MKTIILFLESLILTVGVAAQSMRHFTAKDIIKPFDLEITTHKTTLLVFPAPVQSADRGAKYILAERAKGTDNILKVKAGQNNFQPSNLSVITTDGQLYSFQVRYVEEPSYQAVDLRPETVLQNQAPVDFSAQSFNSSQLEQWVNAVYRAPANVKRIVRRKHGLKFRVDVIYRKNDLLFFRFSLKEKSDQPGGIDTLRFYTREKRQSKRTTVQTQELAPLCLKYFSSSPNRSCGVAVLKQFKLLPGKQLVMELTERKGNRVLSLRISNQRLFEAVQLHRHG